MPNINPIKWELTVTIDPARKILELIDIAYGEGQGPNVDDILRAIAYQHPELIGEFPHLYPRLNKSS